MSPQTYSPRWGPETGTTTAPGWASTRSSRPRRARPPSRRRDRAPLGGRYRASFAEQGEIGVDHDLHQLLEIDRGRPAQVFARLGGVRDQQVYLRRTHERRVLVDVVGRVEAEIGEGDVHEVPDRVVGRRADHIVLGLVALQHAPHRVDEIRSVAPVTAGVEVAERQLRRQAELDRGGPVGDLAGDELEAAARALVVE